MILFLYNRMYQSACIPRMSGDDPALLDQIRGMGVYSPHERG